MKRKKSKVRKQEYHNDESHCSTCGSDLRKKKKIKKYKQTFCNNECAKFWRSNFWRSNSKKEEDSAKTEYGN